MNGVILFKQGVIWLVWELKEVWHFCSCYIEQIKFISIIVSEDTLDLQQCSLGWHFSMGDKLQYLKPQVWLIKYETNLFKIYHLLSLPYAMTGLDHGFLCMALWQLSSSSAHWYLISSSLFIKMIRIFLLVCVGSWCQDGEFSIVSMT